MRERLPATERFAKLLKHEGECVVYTGPKTKQGYGVFWPDSRGTRRVAAHRFAWIAAGRLFSEEKPLLLHSCDNPACCNVEHLRLGNDADNHADMARRWRGTKGQLPFGVVRSRSMPGRYEARVMLAGRKYHLGTFIEAHDAAAIAREAKEMFYASQV